MDSEENKLAQDPTMVTNVTEKDESVMSLDALKEAYANKNAEMKEKYKSLIAAIATKQNVDLGIAFDMLKAVYRGGENYLEGIDIDFNREVLMKDCAESMELSVKIADCLAK